MAIAVFIVKYGKGVVKLNIDGAYIKETCEQVLG